VSAELELLELEPARSARRTELAGVVDYDLQGAGDQQEGS
jgi:hypothetical protein